MWKLIIKRLLPPMFYWKTVCEGTWDECEEAKKQYGVNYLKSIVSSQDFK
jgi:hypothetical protein